MGTKGTRFSTSKPNQRDSLACLFDKSFSPKPQTKMHNLFQAFWTQYVSYCFD